MRDNWAVGWSGRYTVGVWVGNASGAAMHEVSGTSGAAPIWAAVMGFLHAREPSRPPRPPQGLVQAPVRFGLSASGPAGAGAATPLEAARQEWFLAGTQQPLFAIDSIASSALPTGAGGKKDPRSPRPAQRSAPGGELAEPVAARITAPAAGTIVALDPDIPPARQRLHFTATGDGGVWRMDGKLLGRGAHVTWLPWPGRHRVELTDARGRVLDEIRLEVRGAGATGPAPAAVPR